MKFSPKQLALGIGAGATMSLLYAQSAFAQLDVKTIQPITPLDTSSGGLMYHVGNIVNIILIVVGILAVLYLIYGGILYLTAGGDAEKASKGRVAITNAIIGVVIILLALAIYNFVIKGVGSGQTS